jgi:hypothetical protein
VAIDTENKRRSALGRFVLPKPDGTIDQADRQHKVWKYSGIFSSEIVSGVVVSSRYSLIGSDTRNKSLIGSDDRLKTLSGTDNRNKSLVGA